MTSDATASGSTITHRKFHTLMCLPAPQLRWECNTNNYKCLTFAFLLVMLCLKVLLFDDEDLRQGIMTVSVKKKSWDNCKVSLCFHLTVLLRNYFDLFAANTQ